MFLNNYKNFVRFSTWRCCRLNDGPLSESDQLSTDEERANRSLFVQELLLSSLAEKLQLQTSSSDSELDDDSRVLQGAGAGAGAAVGAVHSADLVAVERTSITNTSSDHRKTDSRKNMLKQPNGPVTKIETADKEPSPL